jgi:histone H3/H4
MAVIGAAVFERLFREAGDLDVDETDQKRYQAFIREKIADLLTIAQAHARADGRDLIEARDLPITKGLQETIHAFRRLGVSLAVQPLLHEVATRPQLDLPVTDEIDEELPQVAGGLTLALARTFRIVDPDVVNPQGRQWERAFRIFDLLV